MHPGLGFRVWMVQEGTEKGGSKGRNVKESEEEVKYKGRSER